MNATIQKYLLILAAVALSVHFLLTVLGDLGVLYFEAVGRIPVWAVITLCFCSIYLSYRLNRPSNKSNGKQE